MGRASYNGLGGRDANGEYERFRTFSAADVPQIIIEVDRRPVTVRRPPPSGFARQRGILAKLSGPALSLSYRHDSGCEVFYSRKVGYFLQVLNFEPAVFDGRGLRRPPSEFKTISLEDSGRADSALCALNSNLFFWFVHVFSDCRHVNKREVDAFPAGLDRLALAVGPLLSEVAARLMADIQRNSEQRVMKFGHDTLSVQCIYPKRSKPVIDEIDRVLAKHYGFTDEELDFVINYDIKYRMGADAAGDDGE